MRDPFDPLLFISDLKINPSTHSLDCLFPLLGIALNNRPTLGIVSGNSHLHHIITRLDAKLLINLKLDWKAMAEKIIKQ